MTQERRTKRIVYGVDGEPVMLIDETPPEREVPWYAYVLMLLSATGFLIVMIEWARWEIR